MDLDRLASMLAVELHLDIPGLVEATRDAIGKAHGRGLSPEALREFVACRIEDHLGYAGHGLHRYLTPEAQADWRKDCGRALDKALARAMSFKGAT